MKIAIPMDIDKVCPHFGRSPYFLIVNVDDNKEIVNTKIVDNVPCDGQGHGKAVEVILKEKPDAVICINMGKIAEKIYRKRALKYINAKLIMLMSALGYF